jgi:hypothetical protein
MVKEQIDRNTDDERVIARRKILRGVLAGAAAGLGGLLLAAHGVAKADEADAESCAHHRKRRRKHHKR